MSESDKSRRDVTDKQEQWRPSMPREQPPHSPDLVPSNFYPFEAFKNYLSGRQLRIDALVQQKKNVLMMFLRVFLIIFFVVG
ncbi:hypothetical protein TNCV_2646601 [Trichonephila clavipes]|nr:hypothetical protein TNCV_2646601 [Trichonephila clavipes]